MTNQFVNWLRTLEIHDLLIVFGMAGFAAIEPRFVFIVLWVLALAELIHRTQS